MKLPPKYLQGLTPQQRLLQARLIAKSRQEYQKTGLVRDRPSISESDSPSRSKHVAKFEKKYGFKVTEKKKLKEKFPDTDVDGILAKGRAAYASSGSRPNVSSNAWAFARLASVLTGGKALQVDKDLVGPESLKNI